MLTRIAAALAVLWVAGYPAAADPSTKETRARINRHLKYAERSITLKDYDRAISEYRLINSWAAEPQQDFLLGRVYALKGERELAVKHLQRYLAQEPQGPHAAAAHELLDEPSLAVATPAPATTTATPAAAPPPPAAASTPSVPGEAAASNPAATAGPRIEPVPTAPPIPVPDATPAAPPPPVPSPERPAPTASAAAPPGAVTQTGAVPLDPPRKKPLYRRWWLWTIVGSAAAQGAIGVTLGVTQSPAFQTTLPPLGRALVGSVPP